MNAVQEIQFRNEKLRALTLAYAAVRDRIVEEHKAVMVAPPIPTDSDAFINRAHIGSNMTQAELVRALDVEFHKEIEAMTR